MSTSSVLGGRVRWPAVCLFTLQPDHFSFSFLKLSSYKVAFFRGSGSDLIRAVAAFLKSDQMKFVLYYPGAAEAGIHTEIPK